MTKQESIHSGFGPTSTAEEILHGVDLSGKTAIVTGGYSGIGRETTRALAAAGATVVVPARDREKAKQTLGDLPRVEQGRVDLLDPDSIDAFAREFLASNRPLHILINSAGIMAAPLSRDARGHESQFSTNHLGHFQLTARLWPALLAARGARVVSVSSRAHQFAGVDFEDPNFQRRPYDRWQAYGQSKTANVLFAVELDRRAEPNHVRVFAVHPGAILTELGRYMTDDDLQRYGLSRDYKPGSVPAGRSVAEGGMFKTIEQGAATQVWCATSSQLAGMGGIYCEDVDVTGPLDSKTALANGVASWAIDPDLAKRLWTLSEELTGLRFGG
ncbi:MAG TPA: oxidoreductase [Chthoniobacterales bacterium]|nr:oxidoreductase [Chthoniobacterales bacterium]